MEKYISDMGRAGVAMNYFHVFIEGGDGMPVSGAYRKRVYLLLKVLFNPFLSSK